MWYAGCDMTSHEPQHAQGSRWPVAVVLVLIAGVFVAVSFVPRKAQREMAQHQPEQEVPEIPVVPQLDKADYDARMYRLAHRDLFAEATAAEAAKVAFRKTFRAIWKICRKLNTTTSTK